MKSHQGFTLIEMLMVLIILSVITAFAVPSYQEYARKKERAVAQQEMQKLAMELEKFRGKNFSFAGFPQTSLRVPVDTSQKQTYTITITNGAGANLSNASVNGFTWRMHAVRTNPQAQARNYDLLMTSTGTRCMTKIADVVNKAANIDCGNGSETW